METQSDVIRNSDSFLQIGDVVGGSFFMSSSALLLISIFLVIRLSSLETKWKVSVLIATLIPIITAVNSFFRRSYWIATQTSPVEFRFFDWVLTVPLMVLVFYYLLKPLGAKKGMPIRLLIASFWMLGFGYIGEAIYPEDSIKWGILGSIGFVVIVALIYLEGYPRIFRDDVDPFLRRGYIFLSILLPLGWSIYPVGYMTVPGNFLEGTLSANAVTIMYNFADVLNKGGLALGVYYIAANSREEKAKIFKNLIDNQKFVRNGNSNTYIGEGDRSIN